jgi:hypothetical protein
MLLGIVRVVVGCGPEKKQEDGDEYAQGCFVKTTQFEGAQLRDLRGKVNISRIVLYRYKRRRCRAIDCDISLGLDLGAIPDLVSALVSRDPALPIQ